MKKIKMFDFFLKKKQWLQGAGAMPMTGAKRGGAFFYTDPVILCFSL